MTQTPPNFFLAGHPCSKHRRCERLKQSKLSSDFNTSKNFFDWFHKPFPRSQNWNHKRFFKV